MATTIKTNRKVAAKIEGTPGDYDAPDVLIPYTTWDIKQTYDMIEDEAIVGNAFKDLPVQGMRHVGGPLGLQVETLTIAPFLEAGFGAESAGVYSLPADKNEKSLSLINLNAVKLDKYAGCYIKAIEFTSEAEGDLNCTPDIVGWKAEDRVSPAMTSITDEPTTAKRLVHRYMAGTNGYFRIGDQDNALTSGDDTDIENLTWGINWNFDDQYDSSGQGTLQPLSGQGGRPTVTLSFKLARHTADTVLGWRDDRKLLQADAKYYGSATSILQVEFPNFIISEAAVTDDDVPGVDVVCMVARNGLGTNYTNTNMSFVTAVRASLTNS